MKLTTTRLVMPTLPRPRWLDLPAPVAAALVTFALIAIAALVGRIQSSAPAAAVPTAQLPIVVIQKQQPAAPAQVIYQPAPTAALPIVRWVTAWAAPGGDVLGPIVAPELGQITGRYGDGWVSTLHEGATVWVRVSELGGSLANLAPQAPAPAVSAPIYQVTNAGPPDAPEPTPAPVAQPIVVAAPAQAPAAAPAAQDEPTIHPAFPVYEPRAGGPDPVTFANNATEWRDEHCVLVNDPTTCH